MNIHIHKTGSFTLSKAVIIPWGWSTKKLLVHFAKTNGYTASYKQPRLQVQRWPQAPLVASSPALTATLIRDVDQTGLMDAIELNNSSPMHISMQGWNIVSLTVEQVSVTRKTTTLPLISQYDVNASGRGQSCRSVWCGRCRNRGLHEQIRRCQH